jgi:hypothetical protein
MTPPLPPPTSREFSAALSAKLDVICAECYFDDPEADSSAKKVKTATLNELLELSHAPARLTPADLDKFITAAESLIFRDLSDISPVYLRSDDMVQFTESAWPHLSIHYQVVLALITGVPNHKHFGDSQYIRRLIDRFESPDPNERGALARLIFAIRAARPVMSDAILQMVLVCLDDYLEGVRSPHVVEPALEIVQRYSEEKPDAALYTRHILPLLGSLHYVSFQGAMHQIVKHFVSKLPQTATPTMEAIMGKFPLTHSAKMVEFLRLLSSVLTRVPERELHANMKTIFLLYSRCFGLAQVKVAQAACSVFEKVELEPVLIDHAKILYLAIYPLLLQASRESWSNDIVACVEEVFKTLGRIDASVFQEVVRNKGMKLTRSEELSKWAGIARSASRVDKAFNLAEKLVEIQKAFAVPAYQSLRSTEATGLARPSMRIGSRVLD